MDHQIKTSPFSRGLLSQFMSLVLLFSGLTHMMINGSGFTIEEATIEDIHRAFNETNLTTVALVEYYMRQIELLNPQLRSVLEVRNYYQLCNQARDLDAGYGVEDGETSRILEGIPVLLTDSISTFGSLNSTAGSYTLLTSKSFFITFMDGRLFGARALILGKSSMSEWSQFRSFNKTPNNGWSPRSGQAVNPYLKTGDPCGSSSGAAISVAANMITAAIGMETRGDIICPADHNSVVGFKPTVGLVVTNRTIRISPRQDSIGPITRTVSDAAYVLEAIANNVRVIGGLPYRISYRKFLKKDGLNGKRLGIVRYPFSNAYNGSTAIKTFEQHIETLRKGGATIVDNLEIANIETILNPHESGEVTALLAEFKLSINEYLNRNYESSEGEITPYPLDLEDIIRLTKGYYRELEKVDEYDLDFLEAAQKTNGIGEKEKIALESLDKLSEDGFKKLMKDNNLDAMVTLGPGASAVLAIGGFPGITVPAGYQTDGMPFGILFGGLRGADSKLIEIAYAFEQATLVRKPPPVPKNLNLEPHACDLPF